MREPSLTNILLLLAPLSLMTVGSGQSIMADLQANVVGNGWLTQKEFLDVFAIGRMAPGPNSILVTLIGWKVAGLSGAIIASIGIFLPSSLLLYSFMNVWARFRGAPWQIALERGLAPIASGLIIASSLALIQHAEGGWIAWVLSAIATGIALWLPINPLLLIFGTTAAYMIAAQFIGIG
jgi:chromate transporter